MPSVAPKAVIAPVRAHTPRLDIQGLRAVAVIMVVAFHTGLPVPGGFVGVDVFFVISGYVITGMLMRELAKTGTLSLRSFYSRRIKRLVPALTLVLLVTLGLTFLLGSPFDGQQSITAFTAVGAMLMFANGVVFLRSGDYFATPPTNNPLLNTWSLSVEEQFYLVFPTLLLILWLVARRRTRTTGVLKAGLAVGIVVSFILSVTMTFGALRGPLTDPDWFAFYSSPTRAWEFGIGALLFLLLADRERAPVLISAAGWWLGIVGIAASAFVVTETSRFPGWVVLLPVVSTALVLGFGTFTPRGIGGLTNGPMVAIGDASYSWYLWHWPLIAFAVMILPSVSWAPFAAAIVSLGLAAATLKLVENPIRFSMMRGTAIAWFAAGSVAAVLLASVTLIAGTRVGWFNSGIQQMVAQVSAKHRWLEHCNSDLPVDERGPECTWNADMGGLPVYLVGDSMAGALGEGIAAAGETLGRPIIVGTKGACPFIDASIHVDGHFDDGCTSVVQGSLGWLAKQKPSDVMMSSTLGYLVIDAVGIVPSANAEPDFTYEGKRLAYLNGLGRAVRQLSDAGHRVTVALPPPGFPQTVMTAEAWRPSQCATYEALRDITACGAGRDEQDVVAETAEMWSEVENVVAANGGRTWDPREALCQGGVCATNFGNDWLYLDGSHISVAKSEQLAPVLASLLSD